MADTRNGASISADNLLAKKIVVQVPQITTPMQNVYLVLEGRFRVNLSVTKNVANKMARKDSIKFWLESSNFAGMMGKEIEVKFPVGGWGGGCTSFYGL